MMPEKWEQIKSQILDAFKDVEIATDELEEPEIGEKETVLFTGPLGKMKLEYISRPVVLDKVTHGSRRIGSQTEVEYVYSETEKTHQLKASKWDEDSDGWAEIDLKQSFNL
ncbi:MAG: hypothetical protein AAB791_01195 [Patescibacteria group bacterium]